MNLFKKKIIVVVHDGNFHADDVFACATLSLWAEQIGQKVKIVRTRDKKNIEKADMVVDVGGIYDPDKNRFDHHQKGGAGTHENGIPYASFGLVWKKYGKQICGNIEVVNKTNEKMVVPIDAGENGINITKNIVNNINEYTIRNLVISFRPTWRDTHPNYDSNFSDVLESAKKVLKNEISESENIVIGEVEVLVEIKKQNEPKVLILDKKLPFEQVVSGFEKIKFIVYPGIGEEVNWYVESGKNDPSNYSSDRVNLPESWRGLKDEELVKVSGVKDAVFCTNRGWLAVTKTKEGAIEMANEALRNSSI